MPSSRGRSPPTSQLSDSFPSENAPAPEKPSAPSPTGDPAPRRRRNVSGLSLAGLAGEGGNAAAPKEEQAAPEQIPDDETILSRWPELVKTKANLPRLANALGNARLSVAPADEGKVLTFTVTNEAQRKWIAENLLRSLEATFRQILGCNKVRLDVQAAEYVQEDKIYLPSEQAKDLMSKNEEVKNLVIDLGLDI